MKYDNVFSLIEEITIKNQNKTALGHVTPLGWSELTYKGLGLLARQLACYFINDMKMEKGEKAAILSESKPELGACVFGNALAGLINVPLDIKLTIYEMTHILSDSQPSVILTSAANLPKAKELLKTIKSLKHIIVIDKWETIKEENIISLYSLPKNYNATWVRRPLNSTAFIIYTSGTTGAPKGVEITFKNMLAQMYDLKSVLDKILPQRENMHILSILPMNHLFELTVGFFSYLNRGCSIYYPKSLKPKDIVDVMYEKQVDFLTTVPAFLKLLKSYIESEISKQPQSIQQQFQNRYKVAEFVPMSVRRYMFRDIHAKFGGKFYGCISGGAPLDESVGKFFNRIGIEVFQGYGLSEASPVISIDRERPLDIKSVGQALDSYEVKIDKETGELLVKGPSVMKGYYNRPDLTAEVITQDGWLHTGDIARIDDKTKKIYITGRIKNMIVLSGGKKVFPEEVEAVLEQNPNFAEVCVLGMKKNFGEKDGSEGIVAIVVPTEAYKEKYQNDEELNTAITQEVKKLSQQLASYKRPVKVIVQKEALPRTSTNKISRKEIKQKISV